MVQALPRLHERVAASEQEFVKAIEHHRIPPRDANPKIVLWVDHVGEK